MPPSSYVTITFPKTAKNTWRCNITQDGVIRPERPIELEDGEAVGDGGNGTLFNWYEGQDDVQYVSPEWVEACIGGHGNKEVSSPFDKAGPLIEATLVTNLAMRGYDIQETINGRTYYPGRYHKLKWDSENMKVTYF